LSHQICRELALKGPKTVKPGDDDENASQLASTARCCRAVAQLIAGERLADEVVRRIGDLT